MSRCIAIARRYCNLLGWLPSTLCHQLHVHPTTLPLLERSVNLQGAAQHSMSPLTYLSSCTPLSKTPFKLLGAAQQYLLPITCLLKHTVLAKKSYNWGGRAAQASMSSLTYLSSCIALARTSCIFFFGGGLLSTLCHQ